MNQSMTNLSSPVKETQITYSIEWHLEIFSDKSCSLNLEEMIIPKAQASTWDTRNMK
jgi:hypothetical protein